VCEVCLSAASAVLDHIQRDGALCRYVASGPLVRSSYKAGEFYLEAMLRGDRSNE
jgi:lipoate synthase